MRAEPEPTSPEHPFDLASLCRYFSERSPLPAVAAQGSTHIVRYINPAFSRLVGKARTDLIGRPFAVAVPEGERNGCLSLLDRVYRTGTPEDLAEQEHRQEPPAFWSYAMWAILGPDGRPAGVMIQVADATEVAIFRRRTTEMNESLLLSSIRQHELTEKAEDLSARLQIASQHKNRFMAALSHELRTPLTPILSAAWLLRRDRRMDDDALGLLDMIERNASLEARLIDDLLDMTRIERGVMNLDRRPVDLCKVVEHAAEVCRPDLESAKLALEVDLGEGPFLVDADAVRLQQVFWNLLRNAIKFSLAGGVIRVHCRRRGDSSAVVEVGDGGVGIDPELLPRLFNAFQQGDEGQIRKFGGLGLGLVISKTIVDLHGGSIAARSGGKGMGAVFSVVMPMMAGAPPVRAEVKQGGAEAPPKIRPMRILLVEDHPDGAWATSRLLKADGHVVQWAPDVAAALELAGNQPFDLMICDISLPDGSGFDLMRALRSRGLTLPGITLSGYGQAQDVALSGEAGFAAHLTKPAPRDVLQATIRSVVEGFGRR